MKHVSSSVLTPNYYSGTFSIISRRGAKAQLDAQAARLDSEWNERKEDSLGLATVIKTQSHNLIGEGNHPPSSERKKKVLTINRTRAEENFRFPFLAIDEKLCFLLR